MSTQTITLTDFKQNLGAIVNQAAYGSERIILFSRGEARAALISLVDLRRLEALEQVRRREEYTQRQLTLLHDARALRESMQVSDRFTNSEDVLHQLREERSDELMGLR